MPRNNGYLALFCTTTTAGLLLPTSFCGYPAPHTCDFGWFCAPRCYAFSRTPSLVCLPAFPTPPRGSAHIYHTAPRRTAVWVSAPHAGSFCTPVAGHRIVHYRTSCTRCPRLWVLVATYPPARWLHTALPFTAPTAHAFTVHTGYTCRSSPRATACLPHHTHLHLPSPRFFCGYVLRVYACHTYRTAWTVTLLTPAHTPLPHARYASSRYLRLPPACTRTRSCVCSSAPSHHPHFLYYTPLTRATAFAHLPTHTRRITPPRTPAAAPHFDFTVTHTTSPAYDRLIHAAATYVARFTYYDRCCLPPRYRFVTPFRSTTPFFPV